MKSNYKLLIALFFSIFFGLLITWVDSRPNWDDTGITVAAIILVSAFFGFIMKDRSWLWALSVGIWIPLYNIIFYKNYATLLVLIFSFAGSYAGFLFRKLFQTKD
jgi:hypothetical protein